MTERELTAEVVKICAELGLLWHHCPNSTRCQGPKGFPDLVIAGVHGVIFAELKSDDGETTAEQDLWFWTLNRRGAHDLWPDRPARLWRPADLTEGRIKAWLHLIR